MRRSSLGVALDFAATEAVRSLALGGRAGQRLALPQGLHAERTVAGTEVFAASGPARAQMSQEQQYSGPIPGIIDAPGFGVRLRIERVSAKVIENEHVGDSIPAANGHSAQLETRRQGAAALLQRAAQGEGSAGTQARYGNRAGTLAGAGGRRAHGVDEGRGTGARTRPCDYSRRCGAGEPLRLRPAPGPRSGDRRGSAPSVAAETLQLFRPAEYNRVTASSGGAFPVCAWGIVYFCHFDGHSSVYKRSGFARDG